MHSGYLNSLTICKHSVGGIKSCKIMLHIYLWRVGMKSNIEYNISMSWQTFTWIAMAHVIDVCLKIVCRGNKRSWSGFEGNEMFIVPLWYVQDSIVTWYAQWNGMLWCQKVLSPTVINPNHVWMKMNWVGNQTFGPRILIVHQPRTQGLFASIRGSKRPWAFNEMIYINNMSFMFFLRVFFGYCKCDIPLRYHGLGMAQFSQNIHSFFIRLFIRP